MSGKAPKRKGNGFERELVNAAKERGLTAERAYASNGRALGMTEDVDVLLQGLAIQAKRKKALPSWLGMSSNVDAVAVREDRGETFVIIRYDKLLEFLEATRDA